jgi:hypothetical protein
MICCSRYHDPEFVKSLEVRYGAPITCGCPCHVPLEKWVLCAKHAAPWRQVQILERMVRIAGTGPS